MAALGTIGCANECPQWANYGRFDKFPPMSAFDPVGKGDDPLSAAGFVG
jgi:hypothetical protein